MLWLILGDYGSGKTLRLVIEAYSPEYKTREIWGNFRLNHPNYKKIKLIDLKDIGENKLVLLDEMQNWFNSHDTMSLTNDFFTDFIHDCDKKSIDVFGTSHRFMSIEIDFRNSCHRIIKCERIGTRPKSSYRLSDHRPFRFSTFSMFDGQVIEKNRLDYNMARHYFTLFDTKERIERPNQNDRDLRMLWKHNPKKAVVVMGDVIKTLKPIFADGKKLTHASLVIELGKLGYTSAFEEQFYAMLIE